MLNRKKSSYVKKVKKVYKNKNEQTVYPSKKYSKRYSGPMYMKNNMNFGATLSQTAIKRFKGVCNPNIKSTVAAYTYINVKLNSLYNFYSTQIVEGSSRWSTLYNGIEVYACKIKVHFMNLDVDNAVCCVRPVDAYFDALSPNSSMLPELEHPQTRYVILTPNGTDKSHGDIEYFMRVDKLISMTSEGVVANQGLLAATFASDPSRMMNWIVTVYDADGISQVNCSTIIEVWYYTRMIGLKYEVDL